MSFITKYIRIISSYIRIISELYPTHYISELYHISVTCWPGLDALHARYMLLPVPIS